ncbi:MAG: phosphatase PAP2 family protein [Hyphomicrobiaceae bacterium]|nr:phosphatase PAP2 family protein [Hyphomicrobiaceae bacterium]
MDRNPSWIESYSKLSIYEKAAIFGSFTLAAFLIVDPLVLGVARGIHPNVRGFLKSLTELGRSNWILIPSGVAILVLGWMRVRETRFRRVVGYGYMAQLFVFLFAAVATTGLAASLTKNVLGRARPKLYETLGSLEFQPFTFDADFASFPSGHATTAGALAGVLIIIWPKARVPVICAALWIAATRFLVGAHYFSDAVVGFAFGFAGAYVLRDRLAVRRWLFKREADGDIALRGRPLLDAGVTTAFRRLPALR